MEITGLGEIIVSQFHDPHPHRVVLLTATPKPSPPKADHLISERRERSDIRRHREVGEVAGYDLPQPFPLFGDRPVHPPSQLDFDEWCCQVMRSRIEPMKKIAKTLRSHRALILNYFRARKQLSSGVVEGLNNKAKLTLRKSYGFRTFHVTEIALYHALGKLPEPDVAHRFF
jgi:hypothetical protein